jgi:hypothetical protein
VASWYEIIGSVAKIKQKVFVERRGEKKKEEAAEDSVLRARKTDTRTPCTTFHANGATLLMKSLVRPFGRYMTVVKYFWR